MTDWLWTAEPGGRRTPKRVAVGCPVFERAWVLDRWFDSVEAQGFPLVEYHFVYTTGDDDTIEVIRRRAREYWLTSGNDLQAFRNTERGDPERFRVLAELRNRLLSSVRVSMPDFFISWDSDVIFEPRALRELFIGKPVVGALIEMLGEDWMFDSHPESAMASYMHFVDGKAKRFEEPVPTEPFLADVVMGVVLMSRWAYEQVEYRFDRQGEDIGFARSCEELGIERWLAPAARGLHLHDQEVTSRGC